MTKEELQKRGLIIPGTFDPVFKMLLIKERAFLAEIVHGIIPEIPKELILEKSVFRNQELSISNIHEKKMRGDLIVEIRSMRINIEMNPVYYKGLFERNQAYQGKLFAEQYLEGGEYSGGLKVIQINFDCFTYFDERIVVKFQIVDQERGLIESENYEKYHVSLANVRKKYYNEGIQKLTRFEKCLLLLTMERKEEIEKISEGDDTLKEAKERLEEISRDEKLIGVYDGEKHDRMVQMMKDAYSREKGMEEGRKEGRKEGKKEGLKEGLEKGLEQGLERGKEERNREIVQEMRKQNIELSTICKIMKLPLEEVERLSNN